VVSIFQLCVVPFHLSVRETEGYHTEMKPYPARDALLCSSLLLPAPGFLPLPMGPGLLLRYSSFQQ